MRTLQIDMPRITVTGDRHLWPVTLRVVSDAGEETAFFVLSSDRRNPDGGDAVVRVALAEDLRNLPVGKTAGSSEYRMSEITLHMRTRAEASDAASVLREEIMEALADEKSMTLLDQ